MSDRYRAKKKLVILFDEYPFELDEYSFIKTELEFLVEHFDVVIVSSSASSEPKVTIDERITLYHCIKKFGLKEKIEAVLAFLFSKCGHAEIKRILKAGQKTGGRFYDSIVYLSSAAQLKKYMEKEHVLKGDEVIYSYWFNANCLAALMEKETYPKLKVVSRIHGYDLYNERNPHNRQPFREYMNELLDKIFFVGDTGEQYYYAHWGKPEDKNKKYVVASIGTVKFRESDKSLSHKKTKAFHIVSCSNVIPLKRIHLIIEGLSRITDIDIRWTHFGNGDLMAEIEKKAQELLEGKSNISYRLEGFIPLEEIMRFYEENDIDCFITTSSTEGCPVSIQEAMSYGIPIIATAVGEIPNMIDGNGILLSESPSPEDVQTAIERLYHAGEAERLTMRTKSRALWERKYNAIDNAKRFVEELEKLYVS